MIHGRIYGARKSNPSSETRFAFTLKLGKAKRSH